MYVNINSTTLSPALKVGMSHELSPNSTCYEICDWSHFFFQTTPNIGIIVISRETSMELIRQMEIQNHWLSWLRTITVELCMFVWKVIHLKWYSGAFLFNFDGRVDNQLHLQSTLGCKPRKLNRHWSKACTSNYIQFMPLNYPCPEIVTSYIACYIMWRSTPLATMVSNVTRTQNSNVTRNKVMRFVKVALNSDIHFTQVTHNKV